VYRFEQPPQRREEGLARLFEPLAIGEADRIPEEQIE